MAWQRTTVSSPVEEIVAEVMVEEAQVVTKGDVLAQLAVRKQELEVLRLDQLITKARFIYEATQALFEDQIESKETLMEKKSDLDQLIIARELAVAEVDDRKILAPVSGTIVHRLKDPGESVERVGPLFEIIDVSRLKLMFFLPVEHLPKLEEGAMYSIAFPDFPGEESHQAKLIFIDPQVDARSGLFRARFEFDNAKLQMKPGVRVLATIPDAK
jgi:RND family efflux transporter MFP subunit